MIQKILLSVDTPASTQAAAEFVAKIAKTNQSQVTVMHVYEPEPPSAFSTYFLGFNPGGPSIKTKNMVNESVKLLKRMGIENVNGKLVVGTPIEALKKAVRSLEPDLIVIGSRGNVFPVSTDLVRIEDSDSLNTSLPVLIV